MRAALAPHVESPDRPAALDRARRAGRLERAIVNLLDNAVKWSPPGGPSRGARGGRASSTCATTGPGIDDADLPHVFDHFYRAPAARALPGSGLGLAIVRQVVDAARRHGDRRASRRAAGR